MGIKSSNPLFSYCNKNQSLSSDYIIYSSDNLRYVNKIQANFRGYIFRKKNPQLSSDNNSISNSFLTDLSKQVKEIPIVYSTDAQENNPKILQLKNLLPKFELNEKEKYILNTSNTLKTIGLQYPGNSIYKGTINAKYQREGYGKLFLPDGSIYEGFFKENKMEGRGRLLNIDGFVYDGEFKNCLANGYGKYIGLDGTIYKGSWLNDKQNGIGEESYNDLSHYIGNFKDGKKNGKGKFFFPKGNLYEGNFVNNEIKGEGLYKWKDGRIYMGNWVDNHMNGYGIFYWPDKKKYYGNYLYNNKYGFGIFYWSDGHKYEGFWKDGKQHGFGKITQENNTIYGEWYEGKHIKNISNNDDIENINRMINEKKKEKEYVEFLGNIERYEKEIGMDKFLISPD